jgi:hypothetical protein
VTFIDIWLCNNFQGRGVRVQGKVYRHVKTRRDFSMPAVKLFLRFYVCCGEITMCLSYAHKNVCIGCAKVRLGKGFTGRIFWVILHSMNIKAQI